VPKSIVLELSEGRSRKSRKPNLSPGLDGAEVECRDRVKGDVPVDVEVESRKSKPGFKPNIPSGAEVVVKVEADVGWHLKG